MGLFDFLKSEPKKTDQISAKDRVPDHLIEYCEKTGDTYHAFYYRHQAHIDFYEQEITHQLSMARNVDDAGNAIQYLLTCKSIFAAFEKWCSDQPGGAEFYRQHIKLNPNVPDRVERLEKQIADAEYIYETVVPTILDRAGQEGGVKQADICREFDIGREKVLAEIYRLENAGMIKTEKRGKYVFLHT